MECVSEIVARLSKWPLIHGFLNWPNGKSDEIRRQGLIAAGSEGRVANSFDYDDILGRKDFVFLSTLKLYPDYSFGHDTFLLIDPTILKHPCEFSLFDIGKIIDLIPLSTNPPRSYPPWVHEPSVFDQIVAQEMHFAREAFAREKGLTDLPRHVPKRFVVPNICRSKEFQRYLRSYSLNCNQFFESIAAVIIERLDNLDAYLKRDKLWPFSEEILVKSEIPASYILGFWDGSKWHRWHSSEDSELEDVIENYLVQKQAAVI